MELEIFDDLMDDSVGTGMIDPMTGESFYDPLEDLEQFQKSSKATITTSNSEEGGYKEIPYNLMDDNDQIGSGAQDPVIYELLKAKGFNPESIKIQDEDSEEIVELRFDELSAEEKLQLLNVEDEKENDLNFSEHELEAVEFLRENNMTIGDLAKAIRHQAITELKSSEEKTYEVDDFSDDELFLIDFKNKYGDDFSDDELLSALERAKEDEQLYEKQASKIRENFKQMEEESKIELENQKIIAQQEAERQQIEQIVLVARSMNDMHDVVEMDDNDKEEVLEFMFDKLPTGQTAFDRALSDPKNRYKAAWYLKNGDDVFREMSTYYKGEIAKLTKQIQSQSATKPTAVIKPKNNNNQHTNLNRPRRLEDLYQ